MERKRRQAVSVSIDSDLLEAGRHLVAEGWAWSLSAWVNEALRWHVEQDERLKVGVSNTSSPQGFSRPPERQMAFEAEDRRS